MIKIDRTNSAFVGLNLYTVAERHQSGLVEAIIQEQIKSWKSKISVTTNKINFDCCFS